MTIAHDRETAILIKKILIAEKRKAALAKAKRKNTWRSKARPKQLPPEGDWFVWLILAGRGFGKTRAGSEWIVEQADDNPGSIWGVIGPTWRDTQDVPLRAVKESLERNNIKYRYNASDLHFYLENGSEIIGYSADRPDRIRGANLSGAWCDELASYQRVDILWSEALVPAVRIGEHPRILITTTPRPIKLLKKLKRRRDGSVVVVTGSTFENQKNLSRQSLAEMKRRYEGTRIGRQELYAEILDDAPGALWNQDLIAAAYWDVPDGTTVATVTAVDPSGSAEGDRTGISTVSIDSNRIVHIMADDTTGGTPEHRYETACRAARRHTSGVIAYEGTYGGDNIALGLRETWNRLYPDVPMPRLVSLPASASKADRAHPVVALYEQTAKGIPRIHHDVELPQLCDELTQWEPVKLPDTDLEDAEDEEEGEDHRAEKGKKGSGSKWSPDRMDAMVHAVRYLISTYVGAAATSRPPQRRLPEPPVG